MPSNNRNITRIDPEEGTPGYEVRVMRRGKSFNRFFADNSTGGKRKALHAARDFRDELEVKYRNYTRKELAEIKTKRNSSGIVGVRMAKEVDTRGPNELEYAYWVAQWSPKPGVRRTARFSINKYGEEKAFKLACRARQRGLREMQS